MPPFGKITTFSCLVVDNYLLKGNIGTYMEPSPKNCYNGEILTDITSFSTVQLFLDNPKEATLLQLMNLEALIETLLFHEKIFIIGPTYFGHNFKVPVPSVLENLIEKKIIEVHSPSFCSGKNEFIKLVKETSKSIYPDSIDGFYSKYKEIECEINAYSSYVKYGEQKGSKELAKLVGITNPREINLAAHLMRTHIHFKCLKEIEEKSNSMISYSPHIARVTLVDKLCDRYENRMTIIARRLIDKIKESDRDMIDSCNEICGTKFEISIPILTPWVLEQCKNPSDILDVVLEIKKSSEVKKYRDWCINFQEAIYNHDLKNIRDNLRKFEAVEPARSVREIIRSVPQMDFSLGDEGDPSITFSGLASHGLGYIINKIKTKDLIFLTNIKRRSETIGYSKTSFEKEFNIKLKN